MSLKSGEIDQTTTLTADELGDVLKAGGVPIDSWGQGDAKTLDQLLAEIRGGETRLVLSFEGSVSRLMAAVGVNVYHSDANGRTLLLKEDRQVFSDGRIRRRRLDISLVEKMTLGEDPEVAALRALREEIGVLKPRTLRFVLSQESCYASMSYPGLSGRSFWHNFEATLDEEDFSPEGYVEYQADKTNFYVWENFSSGVNRSDPPRV